MFVSTWTARAALGACLCAALPAFAASTQCPAVSASDIAALFDQWNTALQTGDPQKVVALYAPRSILLPTVSNRPRLNAADKTDYFEHFMALKPRGHIDTEWIDIRCDSAVNAGTYTFSLADGSQVRARFTYTYAFIDGKWLITSHHSSRMPEPGGS